MGKLLRGKSGFTLVELLIVIGIIGILAGVVLSNIGRFSGSGATEANSTELQNLQTAVDLYMADNGVTVVEVLASPGTDDFSSAGTADLDPDPIATAYLYSNYLRTNPTRCTYSWTGAGLVTQETCP